MVINGYKIVEKIGLTNYAEIYKARKNRKLYILKIAPKPELNSLIAREFQILSQFRHKNILKVFDYGVIDKRSYFAAEFIKGKPINQYFNGYSPEFINAMLQILDALTQFHNQGYFHGDLKPGHILYMPEKKRAILIDFGFASLKEEWQTPRGTYFYMAPEVIKGIGIDQRSDLYSLGVIIYEILSNQSASKTQIKKPVRFDTESIIPLYRINPEIPLEISNIVSRLLAIEPALRPYAGEVYETFIKFSNERRLRKTMFKMSFPTLPFIPTDNNIFNSLLDLEKIRGKAFIIIGDKGSGKTRLLNELRYRYLLTGNEVLMISDKTKRFFEKICDYVRYNLKEVAHKDKYTIFEEISVILKKERDKPLVIMIDNLEEFEVFDKNFFRYLGYSIENSMITLIATTISEEINKMGFESLRLFPFNKDKTRALVETTFTNMVNIQEFSDWLYTATGGNPLFIEATLKLLFHKNLLYYRENRWHINLENLKEISCPKTVEEIIANKISVLDDLSLEIIQAISLCNNPIEPGVIKEVLGDKAILRLEVLKQSGLTKEIQFNGRAAYVIANNTISDFINKRIEPEIKKALSRKLFIEIKKDFSEQPDYFSHIAELAVLCGEAKNAYEYSIKSAEIEEKKYNFEKSLNFLKIALDYVQDIDPENRMALMLKAGKLEQKLGNVDEAITFYKDALKYSKKEAVAEIFYNIGLAYQTKSKHNEAIEYFNKSLELQRERDIRYANTLNNLAYSLMSINKFSEAQSFLEESYHISEVIESNELKANVLYLLAVLECIRREYNKAIETANEALRVAKLGDNSNRICDCYSLLGTLHHRKGDLKKAREIFVSAFQLLESCRDINLTINVLINLALTEYYLCNFEAEIQHLSLALNYANKLVKKDIIAIISANLANIYEIKGDLDRAIALNKRAIELEPNIIMAIHNLTVLYFKKGEIESTLGFINRLSTTDKPLYYFDQALINCYYNEINEAESNVKMGFEKLKTEDLFEKIECYLEGIEVYYEIKKYNECFQCATDALKFLPSGSREYVIVETIRNLSGYIINESKELNINESLNNLKNLGCLYDWAYLKRLKFEALWEKTPSVISIEELFEVEEVFKTLNAKMEILRLQRIKDKILKEKVSLDIKKRESFGYLQIFKAISETINKYLEQDDFIERILSTLIYATGAERGAFFFIDNSKLKLVACINLDQETINEAKSLSRTVVKQTSKTGEIICCPDALSDNKFKDSKSVILNQIRAILCVPLKIGEETIGAFYLDSRHKCDLFSDKDKEFLLSVSNIVASTIEKAKVFQKMKRETVYLKMGLFPESAEEYLIGESPSIKEIRNMIDKIAKTDSTVLITGETGSGKGVVAKLIHQRSSRKDGNFIQVNCGGVPDTLFESELFGYKRGAFTGANTDKRGLFEEANGGTLFLDEIANTSIATQGKLLDALETKKIRRLGETIQRDVDIRLICATNRNLKQMIAQQCFREDLYYRISVLTIHMPALREHPMDIPILADYFLKKYSKEFKRNIIGFDKQALKLLLSYPWPGNVRELQNIIERAVILSQGDYITAEDLKLETDFLLTKKKDRKEDVISAIKTARGNISIAARILGVTRCTLYNYIKKYDLSGILCETKGKV
ncbi:MAG: sigma 54-interacting transcriptional regulator [candidate division WOR-3 bacterium]